MGTSFAPNQDCQITTLIPDPLRFDTVLAEEKWSALLHLPVSVLCVRRESLGIVLFVT